MEPERAQNFNDRLNQWVAGQGFWFQLKYSMSGKGIIGTGGFHLVQLGFRLLILLLVVSVLAVAYMVQRPNFNSYKAEREKVILKSLDSKEGKLTGFRKLQGKMLITKIEATGDDGTFYTRLAARNISAKMGLLAGIVGRWNTGTVTVERLNIDLRAGTKDPEAAASLGAVLFKNRPEIDVSLINVDNATVSWGFSELTRGLIERSQLKARRVTGGWRFQFNGGTFTQGWLKGLAIEELIVICRGDGLVFEKALFRKGDGTVDLAGLTIKGAQNPAVAGTAKLRHLPLEGLLPMVVGTFCEGWISGSFRVYGSTNSSEGIAFDGNATLEESDEISLRDRVHLLKAMTVVDVFNSYHRVVFRSGSFDLKIAGGEVTLGAVNLKADDLLTLSGNLKARPPTTEELKTTSQSDPQAIPEFFSRKDQQDNPESSDFTSERVAKESQKGAGEGDALDLLDEPSDVFDQRKLEEVKNQTADSLRYEGELEITLRPDTFERSEVLKTEFPVNPKTGRIHLKVPVNGTIKEVTLKQAEEIHQKGLR